MAIRRRSYDPPPIPSSPMPVVFAKDDQTLAPQSLDGSPTVRLSVARRCLNFNLRCVSFYTSDPSSVHNVDPITEEDIGDVSLTLFKQQDGEWVAADEETATKTVLDWEAAYNFEIIGGRLDTPADLRGGASDQWFVSVVGVPHYPAEYGGSIRYINETNIEAVTDPSINMDGRATSYLAHDYGGAPHTNTVRVIIKHPAGARKRFQLLMEHFV